MSAPEEIITILGKGSAFDGKLTFEGTVQIDGDFSGEIRTEGTLIVGETASVTAQIHASIIRVAGRVEGELKATTRIELTPTASVKGTLHAPSLEIERGALFDGTCQMQQTSGDAPLAAEATADDSPSEAPSNP